MMLDLKIGRWTSIATGALFLGMLWLSPLQSLTRLAPEPKRSENRRLAPRPELRLQWPELKQYPSAFGAYFNDQFGFRKTLVRLHHRLKMHLFGISPIPRVVVGSEGWLFHGERVRLDNLRPFPALSRAELERWRSVFEGQREWLAARNIRYVLMIVPLKWSVYPEYLPRRMAPVRRGRRLHQLMRHLRAHSEVELVDLRPVLQRAKREHRIYHRTDTHWNDLGAHAGYTALVTYLRRWYPAMTPRRLSGFSLQRTPEPGGNLARMLAMGDLIAEERLILRPLTPFKAVRVALPSGLGPIRHRIQAWEGGGKVRAVMLHDSFTDALIPFLSGHFSRIVYQRGRELDADLIRRERPQLVIQEMGERSILRRAFKR